MRKTLRAATPAVAVVAVVTVVTLVMGFVNGADARSSTTISQATPADSSSTDMTMPTDPTSTSTVTKHDAKPVSVKIWPIYKYDDTAKATSSVEGCDGPVQITGFTQTSDKAIAKLSLNTTTHHLFVKSIVVNKVQQPTVSGTFTALCEADGMSTDPVAFNVTLRPVFFAQIKHVRGNIFRWRNNNTTFMKFKVYLRQHLIKTVHAKAHHWSKSVHLPRGSIAWRALLGHVGITVNFGSVNSRG